MTIEEFNEYDTYTVQDWEHMWKDGQLGGMTTKSHPMLIKHSQLLIKADRSNRIFVPLCGNSIDLLWLAQKGCSVVGSEIVAFACQAFFTDNNIPYEVQNIQGMDGNVYRSKDDKLDIRIFQCDHYKLSSKLIGYKFDGVWDRGAFNSVALKQRASYVQHMSTLLTSSAVNLVAVTQYEIDSPDNADHGIPGTAESVHIAYQPFAEVQQIDCDITERHQYEDQEIELGEILFDIKFKN